MGILKALITALAAAAVLALSSCSIATLGMYKLFGHGPSVEDREGGLQDETPPTVSGVPYSFAVVSDVHFGNSRYKRNDEAFYNKLASMSGTVSFCVCLGDVVESGSADEYNDYVEWCNSVKAVLGNNVYTIVGNHDLFNDGWEYFEVKVWPYNSFYRFNAGGIHFYAIDTGSGSMGPKQFKRFKSAIQDDGAPKIILSHYPAYGTATFFKNYYTLQNTNEADSLITLCADNNVKLYLSGHMHDKHTNDLGKFTEMVLPCYADKHEFLVVTVLDSSGNFSTQYYRY